MNVHASNFRDLAGKMNEESKNSSNDESKNSSDDDAEKAAAAAKTA